MGEWGHAQFTNKDAAVDRLLEQGNLQAAFQLAQQVLKQCLSAGIDAYPGAAYDTAMAHAQLARVLRDGGQPQQALPLLQEAREQFLTLEAAGGQNAGRMASVCLTEMGDCFQDLGQYEEAAKQYEAAIALAEKRNDHRSIAVGKTNWPPPGCPKNATRRPWRSMKQPKTLLNKWENPARWRPPGTKSAWCSRKPETTPPPNAPIRSRWRLKSNKKTGPGRHLRSWQLGNLYNASLGRLEDAVRMYERAAELYRVLGDLRYEGVTCSNLAGTLIKLRRYPEAREQLLRAIECKSEFGHAASPWTTWAILYKLETAEGNAAAANNARSKAMAAYAAYRRDGGESRSNRYQWIVMVMQAIQAGKERELLPDVEAALAEDRPVFEKALVRQLFALLRGSRDAALADDPELDYMDAVELQLLLAGGVG